MCHLLKVLDFFSKTKRRKICSFPLGNRVAFFWSHECRSKFLPLASIAIALRLDYKSFRFLVLERRLIAGIYDVLFVESLVEVDLY